MSFFNKILSKIFPQELAKHATEPMVKESLVRSEHSRKAYFTWQNLGQYKALQAEVWNAYDNKRKGEIDDLQVHLLQMPYANGFALTYHHKISQEEFQHFFDLLKDKALNLGYNLTYSDRVLYDRAEYVETKERYYLKPPTDASNTEELFDQKYGNISIEQVIIDRTPSYLKLVATVYSDRLYTEALDFEELMHQLFDI